jgi:hypothetical protein
MNNLALYKQNIFKIQIDKKYFRGKRMSLIMCAKNCQYQTEGYCGLNFAGTVNRVISTNERDSGSNGCIHFKSKINTNN